MLWPGLANLCRLLRKTDVSITGGKLRSHTLVPARMYNALLPHHTRDGHVDHTDLRTVPPGSLDGSDTGGRNGLRYL